MPINVAAVSTANASITYAYAATNLAAYAWVFPTNAAQTDFRFPPSNTSQIVILNRGLNPLLFGVYTAGSAANLPGSVAVGAGAPYGLPAGLFPTAPVGAIVPVEGSNCVRIPIGGALTVDCGSFSERGNFTPIPQTIFPQLQGTAFPVYMIFFSAVGGDTSADITYISQLGIF